MVIKGVAALLSICVFVAGCTVRPPIPSNTTWQAARDRLLETADDLKVLKKARASGASGFTLDYWVTVDEFFLSIISTRSDSQLWCAVFAGEVRGKTMYRMNFHEPVVHVLQADSMNTYDRLREHDSLWMLLDQVDGQFSRRELRKLIEKRAKTPGTSSTEYRILQLD